MRMGTQSIVSRVQLFMLTCLRKQIVKNSVLRMNLN